MTEISALQNKLQQEIGKRDLIQSHIKQSKNNITLLKTEKLNTEQAQTIIQTVAKQTQQQIEFHISNIISMGMAAVFDDPYEFLVEFVERRRTIECDLWFVRNDQKINPMDASGGGPVDLASFLLRVSLWSLGHTRNVLILDEPFKFLSVDLQPKAAEMMKLISEKLNLQIIMVTHSEHLIEEADKIFRIELIKGISKVKEM